MTGTEKRTNEVKVRLEDSLFIKLSQLANMDERTIADYLHHVLSIHVNGHGYKLTHCVDESDKARRDY